jgi:hypothetical protein
VTLLGGEREGVAFDGKKPLEGLIADLAKPAQRKAPLDRSRSEPCSSERLRPECERKLRHAAVA